MNFEEILNTWEKTQDAQSLKKMLKEKNTSQKAAHAGISFKNLPIEATLDLHGMTVPQAENAFKSFIMSARKKGYKKVLVIHGKGIHSKGEECILKNQVQNFIQKNSFAGAHGQPSASDGGSGATWIIIK